MSAKHRGLIRSGLSAFLLLVIANTAFAASTYHVDQLSQFSSDYPVANPAAINNDGDVVGSASLVNSDSGETKALQWNQAGQVFDLSPTAFFGEARDINNLGQVLLCLDYVCYIASEGTQTPLVAGTTSINGYAINDAGQVTGWFASGGQHAVLYDNGIATDLGTLPGGTYSYGYSINNSGQVVGLANNASGQSRAVLWSNGAIVDLGTLPGHTYSVARDINDAGQIVGYSGTGYPNSSSRAFLWENGVMTDLGSVGDNDFVVANSINNVGQIIGSARMSGQYRYTAFLWGNGNFTNLNPVIGDTSNYGCYATAINDIGQITSNCNNQTYRLSPAADVTDVGVEIVASPSDIVYLGSPLTYTILVTNTGSLPATNVSIIDTLPVQMSFESAETSQGNCAMTKTITCVLGNLAAGASATMRVNVIPTATGNYISNSVAVSADRDDYTANNSAMVTVNVREPLILADLGVSISALQNPVARRSNITYIVAVKNNGPDMAKEVLLSDTLSSNPVTLVSYSVSRGSCSLYPTNDGLRCNLGDIANGETATLTITVKPRYSYTWLTYTNYAAVSAKSTDRDSTNNYANLTVKVK